MRPSRRRFARLAASAGLVLSVAGCGLKLVDLGPAPNLYDIHPEPHFAEAVAPVSWQLVIDEPIASTALNTDRIVVRPDNYEIKYYAGVRWSQRAPALVQSKLLEAFDKSGAIVGVGQQTIGLRGDYELQGELRNFDAVYSGGASPIVKIGLNLKIVREPSGLIIASRTFSGEERADGPTLTSIAGGFETVLGGILSDAVPWTLSTAQKDYAEATLRSHKSEPISSARPQP